LLIGSWSAKLPDIASAARRDAVVQIHLVTLLVLTTSAQAKEERRPIFVPPPASQIVNMRVKTAANAGFRSISLLLPAPPAFADEEGEQLPAPPVPIPMRLDLDTMTVERANFDRWLFADEQSESEHWKHLDKMLRAKVEDAGQEHKLTFRQRAKLRLAGRGDIKRFFDRVEESRIDFEAQRQSFRTGHPALLRLEPLARNYNVGPFGDGSLFAKTFRKINDDPKAGD
jgi:hypothetical protein